MNLGDVHWINGAPRDGAEVQIRTRHRAPLIDGTLDIASSDGGTLGVALRDEIRAVTPGQSAVIYDGDLVLGGGVITDLAG